MLGLGLLGTPLGTPLGLLGGRIWSIDWVPAGNPHRNLKPATGCWRTRIKVLIDWSGSWQMAASFTALMMGVAFGEHIGGIGTLLGLYKCRYGKHIVELAYLLAQTKFDFKEMVASETIDSWHEVGLPTDAFEILLLSFPIYTAVTTVRTVAGYYADWLRRKESRFHEHRAFALEHDDEQREAAESFRRAIVLEEQTSTPNMKRVEKLQFKANRAEFRGSGLGDRVNISLNILGDDGNFKMRTVKELPTETVFPAEYLRDDVLQKCKEAVKLKDDPPGFDPFLRIPAEEANTEQQELLAQMMVRTEDVGPSPIGRWRQAADAMVAAGALDTASPNVWPWPVSG
jgi:hypothetical protein